MNLRYHYISRVVLIVAGACVFLIGGIQSQARTSSRGAQLIVQRAPNVGTELAVRLAIDGRPVSDIQRDHRYVGFMSGGRHVLSVVPMPNVDLRRPTAVRISTRPGRTYIFSAGWQADQLVLRRINSATQAAPAKTVPRR